MKAIYRKVINGSTKNRTILRHKRLEYKKGMFNFAQNIKYSAQKQYKSHI